MRFCEFDLLLIRTSKARCACSGEWRKGLIFYLQSSPSLHGDGFLASESTSIAFLERGLCRSVPRGVLASQRFLPLATRIRAKAPSPRIQSELFDCGLGCGGATCGAGYGTTSVWPHCRHLVTRPAQSSGAEASARQEGHAKRIINWASPWPGPGCLGGGSRAGPDKKPKNLQSENHTPSGFWNQENS